MMTKYAHYILKLFFVFLLIGIPFVLFHNEINLSTKVGALLVDDQTVQVQDDTTNSEAKHSYISPDTTKGDHPIHKTQGNKFYRLIVAIVEGWLLDCCFSVFAFGILIFIIQDKKNEAGISLRKIYIRWMDNVASLAVSLGLIGTVIGLVSAFSKLQTKLNAPEKIAEALNALSNDMSFALITTVLGLIAQILVYVFEISYEFLVSFKNKN